MKVIYTICTALLLILTACATNQQAEQLKIEEKKIIDCSNKECLFNNIKTCMPARFEPSAYYEIKGGTTASCNIYIREGNRDMNCVLKNTMSLKGGEQWIVDFYDKITDCRGSLKEYIDSLK